MVDFELAQAVIDIVCSDTFRRMENCRTVKYVLSSSLKSASHAAIETKPTSISSGYDHGLTAISVGLLSSSSRCERMPDLSCS